MEKTINSPEVMGFDVATIKFTTPSGSVVTVRETNGQDEAVLSRISNQVETKGLNIYLSNIILDVDDNGPIKPNDVLKLKVRDKYYILYKARKLSLGNQVQWTHTFKDGTIVEAVEDLEKYDWDYSSGIPPFKGQDGYNPLQATSYNDGPSVKYELSSKHFVQFEYLTGLHEKKTLGINEADLDMTSRLTIRNFKLLNDESDTEGQLIQNFEIFPSRIMAEIRARLDTYDSEWVLPTEIKHPNTGEIEVISLFQLPDFFYPGA